MQRIERDDAIARSSDPEVRHALLFALVLPSIACTRPQVGTALLATGAAAGYEGVGVTLGNRMAVGAAIPPKPEVGVPLLLSGLLAGGIGVSLIAMGPERPTKRASGAAPPVSHVAEPEPTSPVIYPAKTPDPWRADPGADPPAGLSRP